MRNADLVITVNRAVQEINSLLETKASMEGKTTTLGYEVEWEYSENRGMTNNKGKLLAFKFIAVDIPVKKQIQEPTKANTIKDTFSTVKKEAPKKEKAKKQTQDNSAVIKEIIDYLNEKAGTKFRYNSKETVRHINARIKEGYTLEDFKHVIDVKVYNWKKDPKMSAFIRPQTLFGTKMENYVNEKITKPSWHVENDYTSGRGAKRIGDDWENNSTTKETINKEDLF